jgi:proteasome lid subunit RPN8/RPN11
MTITLSNELIERIHQHGEAAYPEEGAGLLLGLAHGQDKHVFELLEFSNSREDGARHNRYLLTPKDYLIGEQEAARLGFEVVGVFHSHPDHPDLPSEFDREWAMPWLSYIITSVQQGTAESSRSWQLSEDRARFFEELILVSNRASEKQNNAKMESQRRSL